MCKKALLQHCLGAGQLLLPSAVAVRLGQIWSRFCPTLASMLPTRGRTRWSWNSSFLWGSVSWTRGRSAHLTVTMSWQQTRTKRFGGPLLPSWPLPTRTLHPASHRAAFPWLSVTGTELSYGSCRIAGVIQPAGASPALGLKPSCMSEEVRGCQQIRLCSLTNINSQPQKGYQMSSTFFFPVFPVSETSACL